MFYIHQTGYKGAITMAPLYHLFHH